MVWATVGVVLGATLAFEFLTCVGRFGLGFRSREIAPRYKKFTFGIRIHHGYVGAAVLPPGLLAEGSPLVQLALLGLAGGLILSDLLHHFVVLPLLTGQFD